MKFKILPKIQKDYPSLIEAIVVLKNIDNTVDGTKILRILRDEEEKKHREIKDAVLSENPRIKAWRNTFRSFGSKPNKFSSSVEALLKRVQKGEKLPDINPLVNLYNYCSIKHILPFGGEDFSGVYGDMELKYCKGDEKYIPIMGKEDDPPDKGEVAWVDDEGVTCRKWNWRQCDRTKITKNTKEGYFIIDGIPPVTKEDILEAANEFIDLASQFLGAKGEIHWLDKNNLESEVDINTKKHKEKILAKGKKTTKETVVLTHKQIEDAKRLKKESSSPTLDEVNFLQIKYKIQELLLEAVTKSGFKDIESKDIRIEHPSDEKHGDYSTNICLILSRKHKTSLDKITKKIKKNFPKDDIISKVEVVNGFTNLKLNTSWLLQETNEILKEKEGYGRNTQKKPIRLIVEFGQPNTHKMPHIGHLFSFVIGESISRITEFTGYQVFRANYQGDVGPQVAKCLWTYIKNPPKTPASYEEKANLLQKLYQEGATAYKEDEKAKQEIDELNKKIYLKDPKIISLWKETREWSISFFKEFEEKLGVHYDRYYYESEAADPGKRIVEENIGNVFTKSKGAIIFEGSKYGLHDRVFITNKGTPTYEAKDMALQPLKYKEWPYDKMVITTAHEQNEYFSVVFKALEKLNKKYKGRLMHLGFGMVNLKSGKMSSRLGNIITGISLIEQGIEAVREKIKDKTELREKEAVSKSVGIGAIKYSLLKGNPLQDMTFDFEESISFEGNSGPYLQYTYARAKSILRQVKGSNSPDLIKERKFNDEELALLRTLYKFPEVVSDASRNLSPNLLCLFLFDLAQKYNLFYKKHRVVDAQNPEVRSSRLAITSAVAQIIKNGLYLLGIDTLEKM